MRTTTGKRIWSALLVLVMLVSMLFVPVMAEESESNTAELTEVTETQKLTETSEVTTDPKQTAEATEMPEPTDESEPTPEATGTPAPVMLTLLLSDGFTAEGAEETDEGDYKLTRTVGEDGFIKPIALVPADEYSAGAFSAELAALLNNHSLFMQYNLTAVYDEATNTLTISGAPTEDATLDLNAILTELMEQTGAYDAELTDDTQTHCVCGKTNCDDTTHGNNITWTAWSNTSDLPTEEGYYYLEKSVTLASTWEVSANVNLCLNGKTITGASGYDAIVVAGGGKLTITDCTDTAGSITHESGKTGRGIYNNGTLTLWKGSISNNLINYTSDGNGAGVYNNGAFTMHDGVISGNDTGTHMWGGGVYNAENETFTMTGGSITKNTGFYAGGVYNKGAFNMTGGSITDNSTKPDNWYSGGGVYNMGTFNLSGKVTITGNKMANGNASNVYNAYDNNTINVKGTLDNGSRVGVYEVAANQIVVTGSTDTTVFTSDRDNSELVADGSNLKWVKVHKHPVCGDSQCSEHGGAIKWEPWNETNSLPTTSGNYYLEQSVTLSEKWELPANTSVNLCLNGCNITKNTPDCVIIVDKNGGNLTITDCKETVGRITHDNAIGWGIKNEGTLTLWNGRIEGAGGDSYAGVFNDGTFTMNGGTITGFKASGVYNEDGTFTMNNGSITGNSTTTDGGGVYNAGSASFNMYGGSITGNAAEGNGGGVYNEGAFKLSGNVTITGNKKGTLEGGTDNNVCLPSDKTITVENGKTLTNDASVGITGALGQTVVSGTTSTTGFTSDNTDYELKELYSGGCGLKLAERTVTISGVTLKTSESGTEMTNGKTYDGVAVAYDATGVSCTPNVSNVTLTYTWQEKAAEGDTYTKISEAPKNAGSYRLHVEAKRDSSLLGEQDLPFTISSKTLTITDLAVANKPYDGTNTAAISGTPKLSGVVEGETVTLVNGEPSFESVNAGDNIPISFTAFSITGDAAKNYTLTQPSGITASITMTVNDGHTRGEWTPTGDGRHSRRCKSDAGHTQQADCHGGTATCKAKPARTADDSDMVLWLALFLVSGVAATVTMFAGRKKYDK